MLIGAPDRTFQLGSRRRDTIWRAAARPGVRIGMLSACVLSGIAVVPARALAAASVVEPSPQQAADPVAEARRLATTGQRPQAVALLLQRLAARPDDLDARTLLGLIRSWDGQYAEARGELRQVLEASPGYLDAESALANVELWDGNAAVALALADAVLRRNPRDLPMLLTRARAEVALGRIRDARDTLDRLLAVDPAHQQARDMRRRLIDASRVWSVGYGHAADWFSDGRAAWQEQLVMVKRQAGFGAVSLTWSQARRYGLTDQQFELEIYPRLRAGTYLYLDAGGALDASLYPSYRAGAHLYQGLGGGFEASIGMSRLGFGRGVNIYIASLSKYAGRWLLIGQVFVTPQELGTDASYHLAVRRYLSDREFVGVRYHHGAAKENLRTISDVQVFDADGVSGELVVLLGRHIGLTCRGAYERQQRPALPSLTQATASARLDFRF